MDRTGTFVSESRNRSGPEPIEPAPQHAIRYVKAEGSRSRAFCVCGFSKKRSTPWIARQAVEAHIEQSQASQAS